MWKAVLLVASAMAEHGLEAEDVLPGVLAQVPTISYSVDQAEWMELTGAKTFDDKYFAMWETTKSPRYVTAYLDMVKKTRDGRFDIEKIDEANYNVTPPKFAYLGDFVTGDYQDASNEGSLTNIQSQHKIAGGLTNYGVWRSAVAQKSIAAARVSLATAQASLKIAKAKAARSKTLYDSLVVSMNNSSSTTSSSAAASLKQMRMQMWNADSAVMTLRFQIDSANADNGSAQLQRIISADESAQRELNIEITSLEAQASSSSRSTQAARAQVAAANADVAAIQASLDLALKEEALAASLVTDSPVVVDSGISMYETYRIRAERAMKLANADQRRVALMVKLQERSQVQLTKAIAVEQNARSNAAHSGWHAKINGDVKGLSKQEQHVIAEEIAFMRAIEASILRYTAELSEARAQAVSIFAAYNAQLMIIKSEMRMESMDVSAAARFVANCEAENFAMKAENEKRLRAAEATAAWKCDEFKSKCKWTYASVELATAIYCGTAGAGLNHKALAEQARVMAQSLKEQKEDVDKLVVELSMRLEDAQNRLQQAVNARESRQNASLISTEPATADVDEPNTVRSTIIAAEDATVIDWEDTKKD